MCPWILFISFICSIAFVCLVSLSRLYQFSLSLSSLVVFCPFWPFYSVYSFNVLSLYSSINRFYSFCLFCHFRPLKSFSLLCLLMSFSLLWPLSFCYSLKSLWALLLLLVSFIVLLPLRVPLVFVPFIHEVLSSPFRLFGHFFFLTLLLVLIPLITFAPFSPFNSLGRFGPWCRFHLFYSFSFSIRFNLVHLIEEVKMRISDKWLKGQHGLKYLLVGWCENNLGSIGFCWISQLFIVAVRLFHSFNFKIDSSKRTISHRFILFSCIFLRSNTHFSLELMWFWKGFPTKSSTMEEKSSSFHCLSDCFE